MNLLVKTENNWSDEIDTEGFGIFTKEAYFMHLMKIEKALKEQSLTLSIGTNEDIEFENIEEYSKQITVSEINPIESAILCKLFKLKVNDNKSREISEYGLLTLIDDAQLEDQMDDTNSGWSDENDDDDNDYYYPSDDDGDETY